jgi:hypothetical protein
MLLVILLNVTVLVSLALSGSTIVNNSLVALFAIVAGETIGPVTSMNNGTMVLPTLLIVVAPVAPVLEFAHAMVTVS